MTHFASVYSYDRFARSVSSERRYIHTKETVAFLRAVLASAHKKVNIVKAGSHLWRAQRGGTTVEIPIDGIDDVAVEDYPYPPTRMKPLPDRARENRANPKGIPYLYLASHRKTAVAEVRPWKGGVVSVGQFRVARDLKLVNTTGSRRRKLYIGGEPSAKERATAVWVDIDTAFSRPTTLTDDSSEYVPTQVLAEWLRDHGFDGIAYRSAYGPGHNVVLFDLASAVQVNGFLVRVKNVTFSLSEELLAYAVPGVTTSKA